MNLLALALLSIAACFENGRNIGTAPVEPGTTIYIHTYSDASDRSNPLSLPH